LAVARSAVAAPQDDRPEQNTMPEPLNCPMCGAPSSADAASCEYCGSRLAAVACAACLGSMFVGSQFCPHCGAKAGAVVEEGGDELRCPGCAGDMPRATVGASTMHSCRKCGSVWLAPDEFSRLCADREATGRIAVAAGDASESASRHALPTVRYVRCPLCDNTMNRVNFGHSSGVVIDVCKGHGIWFENDELRQVLVFIQQGGLERARPGSTASTTGALGESNQSPERLADLVVHLQASAIDSANPTLGSFLRSLFL
jgi:Zn-finger nucleic acid-binding protein